MPELPFQKIAEAVLGKHYELSLTFVGSTRARALNRKHRGKTYVPNVLSFPLDTSAGEIYITPSIALRESKKWGLTPKGYIGFLFIHGLLHLKGCDHGATMEQAEKTFMTRFGLK